MPVSRQRKKKKVVNKSFFVMDKQKVWRESKRKLEVEVMDELGKFMAGKKKICLI